jgi:hypothetical protein
MTLASEMLGVAGHAGSQVTPTGWPAQATDTLARGADPAGIRVLVGRLDVKAADHLSDTPTHQPRGTGSIAAGVACA